MVEGFFHSVHMTRGDLSGVRVSLITEVRNSCRAAFVGPTAVNNQARCPSTVNCVAVSASERSEV